MARRIPKIDNSKSPDAPPKAKRGNPGFKPGVSGNPKGRPKGAKNKLTLWSERERIDCAKRFGITPMEWEYSILRDPNESYEHKHAAALALFPYCHKKMPIGIEQSGGVQGFYDAAALAALTPEQFTKLGEVLEFMEKIGQPKEVPITELSASAQAQMAAMSALDERPVEEDA